jgi:molecular chaperone HtpG
MADSTPETTAPAQPIPFRAETRQLLDILAHSLYTEREIFLRELISNASDALTRVDFEILTKRDVLDASVELSIRILPDEKEKTLTIRDTGIGMTAEEMVENLGTIAHSGAQAFVEAAKAQAKAAGNTQGGKTSEIIGQFGVGFYSAFMVAEWIRVVSRSSRPDAQAAAWFSSGGDTYTIEPVDKAERGTEVIIKLKEDAQEFLQDWKLRQIVTRHSDFIPFPIYIGDSNEQANRQTAIWRQGSREVEAKDYEEFYKSLTLDNEPPLAHAHLVVDAPAQMYAILFIPSKGERGMFSLRREDGLKLYARKVLIQEYCKDLLPEYFRFVQGVVDSEDLPLNVSRESVQSNRVMTQLKKVVTSKVTDTLAKMDKDEPEKYTQFWVNFGRYIKEGIAVDPTDPKELYPLLRFHTIQQTDRWVSLDEYVSQMKPDQKDIYYILGDDQRSVIYSPHLDLVKRYGYDVLVMTDPVDAFMLVRLAKYGEHDLKDVATADLKPLEKEAKEEAEGGEKTPPMQDAERAILVERVKLHLGDRVTDVRMTDRLSDSPARLVDPGGAPTQHLQRVYRMLKEDYEVPKKVLELNPDHPIIVRLASTSKDNPLSGLIIDQVYEDALLIEGLHPDPVGMIPRIQKIIEEALK